MLNMAVEIIHNKYLIMINLKKLKDPPKIFLWWKTEYPEVILHWNSSLSINEGET